MEACDSILNALRLLCRHIVWFLLNLTMDPTRSMMYIVDIISHRENPDTRTATKGCTLNCTCGLLESEYGEYLCDFVNQPCLV